MFTLHVYSNIFCCSGTWTALRFFSVRRGEKNLIVEVVMKNVYTVCLQPKQMLGAGQVIVTWILWKRFAHAKLILLMITLHQKKIESSFWAHSAHPVNLIEFFLAHYNESTRRYLIIYADILTFHNSFQWYMCTLPLAKVMKPEIVKHAWIQNSTSPFSLGWSGWQWFRELQVNSAKLLCTSFYHY